MPMLSELIFFQPFDDASGKSSVLVVAFGDEGLGCCDEKSGDQQGRENDSRTALSCLGGEQQHGLARKNQSTHWQSGGQTGTPANVCRRDQRSADHHGKKEQLSLHGITGARRNRWPCKGFRNPCSRRRVDLAGTNQGMAHPFISAEGGVGRTRRHEP